MAPKSAEKKPVKAVAAKKEASKEGGKTPGKKGSKKGVESWKVREGPVLRGVQPALSRCWGIHCAVSLRSSNASQSRDPIGLRRRSTSTRS